MHGDADQRQGEQGERDLQGQFQHAAEMAYPQRPVAQAEFMGKFVRLQMCETALCRSDRATGRGPRHGRQGQIRGARRLHHLSHTAQALERDPGGLNRRIPWWDGA